MNTGKIEPLWPYLLFLPDDPSRRDDFIRSVLASRLARSVLSSFDESGRALQRDLVENLPHSNKSILSYLKTLGKFNLITTGTTIHQGKRVVFHELTKNGWGLARFYFEGLPSDVEELTSFLLEDYLIRLATLYREQGLPESSLFGIFARTRAKAILDGSQRYVEPDCILFGASAYYTKIHCETLPPLGGLSSCGYPTRSPGGPTLELALALAKDGFKSTLVSSVGNDIDGWNIITNLIQGNVDVQNIVVENKKQTNKSIILDEPSGTRILVGISPSTSLSITSPAQVPWETLEKTKVVYIGEVFLEVASSIAANAKARNIPVVYRCSVPYWEMGLNRLKPVLTQIDTLLISNRAWGYLKKNVRPNTIQKIRNLTEAGIVIRETHTKYRVIENGETHYLECDEGSGDVTEWVVATLIRKMSEGTNLLDALQAAIQFETKRLVA